MDHNLLSFTHKTPLTLKWKNAYSKAGLCFSCTKFEQLKETRGSFLHLREEAYFRELAYAKRQYSYLVGRYCAKQAIMACNNEVDLIKVCIEAGAFEHPVITDMSPPHLQVSISHTDTLGAAIAFPESYPMAIDIETICFDKKDILKSQFSPHEQNLSFFIHKEHSSEVTRLTLLWTIKEALSKVLKCGLTVPFEVLEIDVTEDKGRFLKSTFKNFKQYQALSFCVGAYACSIVYPLYTSFTINIDEIQRGLQEQHT